MATKAAKKSGKQKRKESRRLVLPREDAKAVDKYSRRGRWTADGGRRQEGLCCADSYSRTTKAAKKSGKQKRKEPRRLVLPREDAKAVEKYSRRERRTADADGDKKARAAQRATQGRHLHGYQGCRQVQ